MPRWQIDIEKRLGQEFWTNVWNVDAGNLQEAIGAAQDIILMEQAIHTSYVTFTKARVRTPVQGDFIFETIPINELGTIDPLGDSYLPLFNCVRVDFGVSASKPSRKYFRLPLLESQQTNGLLVGAFRLQVEQQIAQRLIALQTAGTPLVDVDAQPLNGANVAIDVAMRQLRRGSKRKEKPVIPD